MGIHGSCLYSNQSHNKSHIRKKGKGSSPDLSIQLDIKDSTSRNGVLRAEHDLLQLKRHRKLPCLDADVRPRRNSSEPREELSGYDSTGSVQRQKPSSDVA